MLGLVFTFEDDPEQPPAVHPHSPAKRMRDAVSLAVNFVQGISFEELTDDANTKPKIAVIFDDVDLLDAFTARLTLALRTSNMRVESVRAISNKESSEEDVAV
ncbi:MAG TPA: hypothetical protein VFB32_06015 [Rudaea sp.]|nr:hypothetical protein [Rudaea sp.]